MTSTSFALGSAASAGRATVLICFLVAVCEGIDLQAAGIAAEGIIGEYQPTPDSLGTFFGAGTLGLFFGALIGGRLADSVGRKWVLVISVGLFGVFSLLTALSWDMVSLSVARLLTGVGLGGALPNMIALASESAEGNSRNARVALVYSGTPFGGALVSALGMFIPAEHWRWIFIGGAIAPLLLVPVIAIKLRESAAFQREVEKVAAAAASGAQASRQGVFRSLFGDGRGTFTILLWISFALGLLTLYLLMNWLPTLMVEKGMTRVEASAIQIFLSVGGAVASIVTGRLLDSRWRSIAIFIIFLLFPILLLALAQSPPELLLVGVIVTMLGCAMTGGQAFLYATAPVGYPTAYRGIGVGAAVAAGRIGSIIGPKLGGWLRSAGHDSSQLLMALLPLAILGSICALLLSRIKLKHSRND